MMATARVLAHALLLAACAMPTESTAGVAHSDLAAAPDVTLIQTQSGPVRGTLTASTREFLGIPYAQPPLGTLRFAAPRAIEPWPEIRDATHFGKSCMQADTGLVSQMDMSEDCLTLNVFAPASHPDAALPVMFFIHGGAFLAGGSSTYDAKALREAGNVVVVTINYRLGAFGFLAHPELCSAAEPCTNQGLRDQQLALRWVRDNIAAFGGDAQNITVFGESAGSVSACLHMAAHGSEGLAKHFILQSGSCVYGPLGLQNETLARAAARSLIDKLCPGTTEPITCLRDTSAADLASVVIDTTDPVVDGYWPWLDGALFEAPLEQLLEQGRFAEAPVIVGTNQHEWLLWQALGATPAPLTNVDLRANIDRFFPDASVEEQVAKHYIPDNPLAAGDAFTKLMTDAYFRCPSRALVRSMATRNRAAYLYEFAVQPAAHALEVDYVFDMLAVSALFPFQAPNPLLRNVVQAMQGYWTQLSAAGDPNRTDLPRWPTYATARERLVIQEPLSVSREPDPADCDLWDKVRMPPR